LTNLGFTVAANATSDTGTYVFNVTNANANTFNAVAAYQKTDGELSKCGTFTIDGRQTKGSTPYNDCWSNTRR
jgi:hypothetical protein